jgi:integrase
VIGLLLGCGLRRSETVNLRLDQLQLRESHWVISICWERADDCGRSRAGVV